MKTIRIGRDEVPLALLTGRFYFGKRSEGCVFAYETDVLGVKSWVISKRNHIWQAAALFNACRKALYEDQREAELLSVDPTESEN